MILIEATRIERIAVLTHRLVTGRVVVTGDFAREFHVTPRTVQRDFAQIARVLPIYSDNGRWVYDEEVTVSISPY